MASKAFADCAVGPVFELGGWSVQQCPSCLPDEMFSVWQGDMRIVHRLHRYDAETLVRVVAGAIADAREQASKGITPAPPPDHGGAP